MRSIPACTGEPDNPAVPGHGAEVYPRVYGGTSISGAAAQSRAGLSPRVRGNRWNCGSACLAMRSIPACTGEPTCAAEVQGRGMVYPRVYGGTGSRCQPAYETGGLSRVYGGTPVSGGDVILEEGLSPRVRGNQVYADRQARYQGLSPRVRGNRCVGSGGELWERSIPACTGEPDFRGVVSGLAQVYPRVYGGTLTAADEPCTMEGLSPRVRGNRVAPVGPHPDHGSIPACTGEPLLISLHFLPPCDYCVVQRDAIQIVKELFVLGWTASLRENDALLIHQLNGRCSKHSNDLSAWMTRVLPRHDNGASPKFQEPFRDHRPYPLSDTGGKPWRGIYSRGNLQHARGKKPADTRGNITCHYYRHRRQ